jgi:hypothetical protein
MTDFADILSCSHRSHPLIKGPSKTLIEANDGLLYLQMGSYTSLLSVSMRSAFVSNLDFRTSFFNRGFEVSSFWFVTQFRSSDFPL